MQLRRSIALLAILIVSIGFAIGKDNPNEAGSRLPDSIASFQATGPASAEIIDGILKKPIADPSLVISQSARSYRSPAGESFWIEVLSIEKDSAAYALLTEVAAPQPVQPGKVGIAGVVYPRRILFYKGNHLAQVEWTSTPPSQNEMVNIARAFADTLPSGDDEVPVLTKHLPNAGVVVSPLYAVSSKQLETLVRNQPVLEVISFDGGTEAVVANYGQSQLVIVEFTTPQLSIDNDSRIWTAIADLKSKGQPVPTAYRRVGNYSVFVFNAPDEKTATALVDQVKYEQVVQWLGDDPHLYDRLQRYFAQTSAGVLVAVLKSSGLSLILCLGAGALIGAMMFRHRRAQKATMYSDAGGSIRLNLDELTGPANTGRLLESANSSERESSNT